MRRVCWLLIILLCYTSSCRCNEQQVEIQCRKEECPEHVIVPCPNMAAEEETFKLFRNNKLIYLLYTDTQKPSNQTDPDVLPQKDEKGKLVGFNLTRKAITKQAVYVCEGTSMYPPPITTKEKSVLVLEDGQGCPCKTETYTDEKDNPEKPKANQPVWIWIVVVVLLSTYSLVITIAATVLWYKIKDADSQNDYINTKPRPPPKARKKRGLQHPIPKHF